MTPPTGQEAYLSACPCSGVDIDYCHRAPCSTHCLTVLVLYLHLPHLAPATGVHRRPDGGQDAPGTFGSEVAGVYLRTECGFVRGTVQEGPDAGHRLG